MKLLKIMIRLEKIKQLKESEYYACRARVVDLLEGRAASFAAAERR
jgi:hypothetical protein